MRRVLSGALALLALLTATGAGVATAAAPEAASAPPRLVSFHHWGPLWLGMTHREAWRTGMVSHEGGHCAPGYEMTRPYRSRGFVVWGGDFPRMSVKQMVLVSATDHTAEGVHVGTSLRELRNAYPALSAVRRGTAIDGRPGRGSDLWVAAMRRNGATLNFQFAYGARPGPRAQVQQIVISRKPTVYWGC